MIQSERKKKPLSSHICELIKISFIMLLLLMSNAHAILLSCTQIKFSRLKWIHINDKKLTL